MGEHKVEDGQRLLALFKSYEKSTNLLMKVLDERNAYIAQQDRKISDLEFQLTKIAHAPVPDDNKIALVLKAWAAGYE